MSTRQRLLALPVGALILATACVQPQAALGPSSAPQAIWAAPDTAEVEPVSLRKPTAEAAAGIEACGVANRIEQLQGIGIVAHAHLLPHYVPLAGGEPEIQSDQPAFVAYFDKTVRIALRGGEGAPPYVDIQGATCVVIDGYPVWFQTGTKTDPEGKTSTPLPAKNWDRRLPAPLP